MDAYETWLTEQVAYWTQRCLESAAQRGRPAREGVRYADQELKSILETFEDCLEEYRKFQTPPAPPQADQEA